MVTSSNNTWEVRVANAFVAGGIEILEELAYVPLDELLAIDGITESEVQHFRQRAREHLLRDALDSERNGGAFDA